MPTANRDGQLLDELGDDREVIDVLREIRNAVETISWRSNDRMVELLDLIHKECKQQRAILARIEKQLER
jgi:hypothetical protein